MLNFGCFILFHTLQIVTGFLWNRLLLGTCKKSPEQKRPAPPGSTKAGWKSIFDGLLNWWFGFLGCPYIKDCYLGVPLKSQTTGPQTKLPLVDL